MSVKNVFIDTDCIVNQIECPVKKKSARQFKAKKKEINSSNWKRFTRAFCCFELSHLQLTKILRKCERVYI